MLKSCSNKLNETNEEVKARRCTFKIQVYKDFLESKALTTAELCVVVFIFLQLMVHEGFQIFVFVVACA